MGDVRITHTKRNTTLDVIRGIAVLLIIVHHIVMPEKFQINNLLEWIFRNVVMKVIGFFTLGGWVGVDLFFVLSGFLVSGLLFSEYNKIGKINMKRFLLRRGFKIYPAFIFFILFTFLVERLVSNYTAVAYHPTLDYVKDLFFLHNYLEGRWDQTWSLDIEEFFYLFLPVFFYILIKKQKVEWVIFRNVYLFLLIFGIVVRAITVFHHPAYNFSPQYGQTHIRLDSLFLGVLISYLFNYHPQAFKPIVNNKTLCFSLASLLIISNFFFIRGEKHMWIPILMLAINPIAFGVLIILALNLKHGLKNNFMEFIGKNSYSIYLWHYVLVDYFKKFVHYINTTAHSFSDTVFGYSYMFVYLAYVVFYLVFSVLIGVAFGKLIEVPFVKLRDRLYPSTTKPIISPLV